MFRIVSNIWPDAKDCSLKVAVSIVNDLQCCHSCVTSLRQRCHNTRLNNGRTRWTCHRGELEQRRGSQLKLSKNRLACCLHTIYYKRLYILMYVWHIYKYMECSILFYCGHEENMHEACVGQRVLVTGCDILVIVTREYG